MLRILGNPKYPNSPGSPAQVAGILRSLRTLPGHEFWSEDFSVVAAAQIDASRILTSAQVTDTYLLALAQHRGGQLATFDRRLSTKAFAKGKSALCLISTATRG